MKDKTQNEGELKARLAQAEVHFSHYRWDEAIAAFEAILALQPDHPAAGQGWANTVEQKSIDEELKQTLSQVRASLAARRFDEALSLLNTAQARGALSHILKYHSEIDGLRSEAQEGQEWQRRSVAAMREAAELAGRRRFDQALEVLDSTLRPLNAHGWERLGLDLAGLREKLLAERDVSERIQFAQAAYEREDYKLAAELAAGLREDLPDREDVRRLHERSHGAWGGIEERLVAVNQALADSRTDDALALLAALRAEHPRNPDWQAIALRVHLDQGRAELAKGRAAMTEQAFDDAAESFEASLQALTTTVEIFPEHPTSAQEQSEAKALRDAALAASQAAHDRAAYRWEASRGSWQASREQLNRAAAIRGRDFGEVASVIDAMLGEAQASLDDLEQARMMLADGRQALSASDATTAREAFRAGLGRVEGGHLGNTPDLVELREGLSAGLRESERIQRDVKKLLNQAEAAGARDRERLALLQRAYERWQTAPGLSARLAEELLRAAAASAEAGNAEAALAHCRQVGELSDAPAGALSQANRMAAGIEARRDANAVLAQATALLAEASRTGVPSPEPYGRALAILGRVDTAGAELGDVARALEGLRARAEDGQARALAAQPALSDSERHAAAGEWRDAADALARTQALLGSLAGPELEARLAELSARAEAMEKATGPAAEALQQAETACDAAADGDLAAVDWEVVEKAMGRARKALRSGRTLAPPLPKRWEELTDAVGTLERRSALLRRVHEQVAGGQGIEAIPALQAHAAADPHPVVLAVLGKLTHDGSGDAASAARKWQALAVTALERGELATAEAYLGLAESYAAVEPRVIPEVRRIDRQVALLGEVRSAACEARDRAAAGDLKGALARYRNALELAADGEAGLPVEARREINRVLDLAAVGAQRDGPTGLLGDAGSPLFDEFVAPVLLRWWRLTWRAAALATVEAQLALGRETMAAETAAELAVAYPEDPMILEAYRTASSAATGRQLGRWRRRLRRARRLAEQGEYAKAWAEVEPEATAVGVTGELTQGPQRDEAEELAEEAADLSMMLARLLRLSEKLGPLLEEMRNYAVTGQFDEALGVRRRAELLDPRRRASALWEEVEQLAALIEQRQAEGVRGAATTIQSQRPAAAPVLGHPVEDGLQVRPGRERSSGQGELLSDQNARSTAPVVDPRAGQQPAIEASAHRLAASPEPAAAPVPTPRPPAEAVSDLADRVQSEIPADAPAPDELLAVATEIEPSLAPVAVQQEGPPAPFDLDDWLSNVTELDPEDDGPGNGS